MKYMRVLHDSHVRKYEWVEYQKLINSRAFRPFKNALPLFMLFLFLFSFMIGMFYSDIQRDRFCEVFNKVNKDDVLK